MTSSPGCLAVPNAFPQNMIRSTVSSFETRHSFFFFLVNDYPITYLSPKIQRGVGGGGRREGLGDGQNLSLSLLSSQDEQEAAQQKRNSMAVLSLQTQRGTNPGNLLGPVSEVICDTFVTYYHLTCTTTCSPFPEHTKVLSSLGHHHKCQCITSPLSFQLSVSYGDPALMCLTMCSSLLVTNLPPTCTYNTDCFLTRVLCGSSYYNLPQPFG